MRFGLYAWRIASLPKLILGAGFGFALAGGIRVERVLQLKPVQEIPQV